MRLMATAALGCAAVVGSALVTMPDLFSDHMVLQRDRPCRVWGWAEPNEQVTVRVADQSATATANGAGAWEVSLKPVAAGAGFTLEVEGLGSALKFKDVAFGDVWICSGQSNMWWPLRDAAGGVAGTDQPTIRLFEVPQLSSPVQRDNAFGAWSVCAPESARNFSAVAFHFGRRLAEDLDVPIGLIQSAYGGTPVQAWMPADTPALASIIADYEAGQADVLRERTRWVRELAKWQLANYPYAEPQPELVRRFATRASDLAGWRPCVLPGSFGRALGRELDGVVWFRRRFDVPEEWTGRPLVIELGPIHDFDHTYVNGELIGTISIGHADTGVTPRSYSVEPGNLRPFGNILAVRVYDVEDVGGFAANPAEFVYGPVNSNDRRLLTGEWEYAIEFEASLDDDIPWPPVRPMGPGHPDSPVGLYNAMIAPLERLVVRGAIWYQGEWNAHEPEQYAVLFPAMIGAWRKRFGPIPFLFVQLAGFEPGFNWAWIREAQAAALELPATGMAVALDIGEANDIHPRDKRSVGERLALLALHDEYGRDVVARGPTYKSFIIEGDEVRIRFDTHGSAMIGRGGLHGFEIAGSDGEFYPATAVIVGSSVVVSHPSVPEPRAVRYGWASNPRATLYNRAGLPAAPFRTDSWPRPDWSFIP